MLLLLLNISIIFIEENLKFNRSSQKSFVQRRLALFDFDGTVTERDSFIEFIKYYKGPVSLYSGLVVLSPLLLLLKARVIKNWKVKELVFIFFFRKKKSPKIIQ